MSKNICCSFCGRGGTRTLTPLGPTVFKTVELRPTALTLPKYFNKKTLSQRDRV